jgi:hypothetical protein
VRLHEEVERSAPSPPVHSEVGIEGKDRTGLQQIGEVHQARVRQIHGYAGIALHQSSDRTNGAIESKGDLKDSAFYVREHCVWSAPEAAQKVTGLGDDRLACHERSPKCGYDVDASPMVSFAAVEEADDYSGVEKDGFHLRPKPRK